MRADLAELWCLGVNFPFSWWVSCLHPELRPVLSWHRGEEMSPAWCDWARASREHHRPSRTNSLTIKPGSQSTLFKKAPDREPEGTQIWVCVSSKENSKIQRRIRWNQWVCLVLIQNLPASWVTATLTQVHQELTWFPVSLARFCTALQESQWNPGGIPCEARGIKLLHSAFFYACTQTTAKSKHLWVLETLQLFQGTHTVESQLKSLTYLFLELYFHLETIRPKF